MRTCGGALLCLALLASLCVAHSRQLKQSLNDIENIVNQFVPADQRPALYSAAATVISSVPGAAGLISGVGGGGGRSPSSGGGSGGGRSPGSPSNPSSQGAFCTTCGPSGPAPAGSPPSSGSPSTPAPARGSGGGNGVFDTSAPPATQG